MTTHFPHPRWSFKSACGLPFGGWRTDGKRHTLPVLSDVSTCGKCNWYKANAALREG